MVSENNLKRKTPFRSSKICRKLMKVRNLEAIVRDAYETDGKPTLN
ncbi:MAG: hypothetical protein ABR969_00875 [Sedimentisphaerales bacterium]